MSEVRRFSIAMMAWKRVPKDTYPTCTVLSDRARLVRTKARTPSICNSRGFQWLQKAKSLLYPYRARKWTFLPRYAAYEVSEITLRSTLYISVNRQADPVQLLGFWLGRRRNERGGLFFSSSWRLVLGW